MYSNIFRGCWVVTEPCIAAFTHGALPARPWYLRQLKLSEHLKVLKSWCLHAKLAAQIYREYSAFEQGFFPGGLPDDSQGLADQFGKGKIAAFGDSNEFVAMVFDGDEGKKVRLARISYLSIGRILFLILLIGEACLKSPLSRIRLHLLDSPLHPEKSDNSYISL